MDRNSESQQQYGLYQGPHRNDVLKKLIASSVPVARPEGISSFDEQTEGGATLLDEYAGGRGNAEDYDVETYVQQLRQEDEPGEDVAFYLELTDEYQPAPAGGGKARPSEQFYPHLIGAE